MWKENRSVNQNFEATKDSRGGVGKRPDIGSASPALPLVPDAEAEKAAKAVKATENAEADAILKGLQAKEDDTQAGVVGRIDALEKGGILDKKTAEFYKQTTQRPGFEGNAKTIFIAKIEEAEKTLAAKLEAERAAGPTAEGGIDLNKKWESKALDNEVNAAIAAIESTANPLDGKALDDYLKAEGVVLDYKAAPKAASTVGDASSGVETQVDDQDVRKGQIAGIEKTHAWSGKAIEDLGARIAAAKASFKEVMDSAAGRRDLLNKIKAQNFNVIDDAYKALQANYEGERAAVASLKASPPDQFNTSQFLEFNTAVQGGLDSVGTQLEQTIGASNEVAKTLQTEAQKVETEEAKKIANEANEARIAEEARIAAEVAAKPPVKPITVDISGADEGQVSVVEPTKEKHGEKAPDQFADFRLKDEYEIGLLRKQVEDLNLRRIENNADESKMKALNKKKETEKLSIKEETELALLTENRDKRSAEGNEIQKQWISKGIQLGKLEKDAGTHSKLERFAGAYTGRSPESLNDAEKGKYLVAWRLSPLRLILGKDFADKANDQLNGNLSFGEYLVQLDAYITEADALSEGNPDLKNGIDNYKNLVVTTAIQEVTANTANRGLTLNGSKLADIGREFDKLALTINNLGKLKGKVDDAALAKLRGDLVKDTVNGQREINAVYALLTVKEKFNQFLAKGYITQEVNAQYQELGSLIALQKGVDKLEALIPEFEEVKKELTDYIVNGYLPKEDAEAVLASHIDQLPMLKAIAEKHRDRIAAIEAIIAQGVDFPAPQQEYISKLKLLDEKAARVFMKENSTSAVAASKITPENARILTPEENTATLADTKQEETLTISSNLDTKTGANTAPKEAFTAEKKATDFGAYAQKDEMQFDPIDIEAEAERADIKPGYTYQPEQKEVVLPENLTAESLLAQAKANMAEAEKNHQTKLSDAEYEDLLATANGLPSLKDVEEQVKLAKAALDATDQSNMEASLDAQLKVTDLEKQYRNLKAQIEGLKVKEYQTVKAEPEPGSDMVFTTADTGAEPAPAVVAPTPAPPVANQAPPKATPSS